MSNIEWHADDYGMTLEQSQDILDCFYNGCLNGISIMANSNELPECMELLNDIYEQIDITIHLNLAEGHCCSTNINEVSLLVDKDRIFNKSFVHLLIHSFLPGRKKYTKQITNEFLKQIDIVNQYTQKSIVRLDSHVHYHMIPIVFDALIDVIKVKNLDVEYLRIPDEPITIYIKNMNKIKNINLTNIVKVLILKVLAFRNKIVYKRKLKKPIPDKIFMGVMLSGHMFLEDVKEVLPSLINLSQKKGKDLEVLFHPGGIYEKKKIQNITNRNDYDFLTSDNRKNEANTLINIGKEI